MHNSSESSHVNHVGVAVLLFILGSIVGYYAGAAYEADAQNQSAYDQSYFFGLKKKKATITPAAKSTTTTASSSPVSLKTFTNNHFSFSVKYSTDWVNFANGSAFDTSDPDQLFGSTVTANKHLSDDPKVRWNYLNTEPVIHLSYGYYSDNTPRAALKSSIGAIDYNSGTISDYASTSGEKGLMFIGKNTTLNQTDETAIFTLPSRNPVIVGQGKPVVFLTYSYKTSVDKVVRAELESMAKSFMINK